jgi:pSer/pThr/pTyr-binding forkhead associated (FHA) protein
MIRTAHRVGYAFGAPIARPLSPSPAISRWILVGARRIPIVADETLIGRDPSSPIRLDAGGVSRRHARILVVGADALIEDLGSKNGTMVRGRPLEARVVLTDGDEIGIGPVTIVYRSSSDGMPTETLTGRR